MIKGAKRFQAVNEKKLFANVGLEASDRFPLGGGQKEDKKAIVLRSDTLVQFKHVHELKKTK